MRRSRTQVSTCDLWPSVSLPTVTFLPTYRPASSRLHRHPHVLARSAAVCARVRNNPTPLKQLTASPKASDAQMDSPRTTCCR